MKLLSKLLDKTTIAVQNLTKELASDIAGVRDADNGGSFISVGVIIYAVNDQPPLELQQQDMINFVQGIMAVIDENHDKEEKNDNDNDDELADEDDDDESAHVTHAAKPATPGFAHLRRGSAPINEFVDNGLNVMKLFRQLCETPCILFYDISQETNAAGATAAAFSQPASFSSASSSSS